MVIRELSISLNEAKEQEDFFTLETNPFLNIAVLIALSGDRVEKKARKRERRINGWLLGRSDVANNAG